MEEHGEAVLTRDLKDQELRQGDVGTVVSIQYAKDGNPAGYTLEIYSITGESLGVRNVEADAIRAAGRADVTHARTASA